MATKYRMTLGALGLAAGVGALVLAGPAGAWDELPCGETEQTAHVCAPGEVARNGTVPNPLPVPAPTPTERTVVPPPPPVVPPPAPLTCADLMARYPKAGPKRVRSWGCAVPPKPPPRRKKPVCAVVRFSDTFVPNHTLAVDLGGAPVYTARTTVTAIHGHVRGVLRARFLEDYSYFLRPGRPRSVGMRLNLPEGQSRTIALPFNHTPAAFKQFFNLRFTAQTNCSTTSINRRRFETKATGIEDRVS